MSGFGATTIREQLGARVTRAEALARHLETEIAAEELAPGKRLGTKEELRKQFGVAAATINEAVRLMESRGLVSARPGPGGGVFVSDVSARSRPARIAFGLGAGTTLRDCLELREALEPLICVKAARACTPRDLEAMHKVVDAMEEAGTDERAFFRLNWALHRIIGGLCDNPPLQSIYRTVVDLLDDGFEDFEFEGTTPADAAVHRRLVEAIGDGDLAKVRAALSRHATRSPLHL